MIRIKYGRGCMHAAFDSWCRAMDKHPDGTVSPFREVVSSDGCFIIGYTYDIKLA